MDFDEEMEFRIVGSTEANSLQNKISNESPVGHALIGKSVGDVVDVETQAGDDPVQGAGDPESIIRSISTVKSAQRSSKKRGRAAESNQECKQQDWT